MSLPLPRLPHVFKRAAWLASFGWLVACTGPSPTDALDPTATRGHALLASTLIWPTGGSVNQLTAPYPGHPGIDIGTGVGTPVYATADGAVVPPYIDPGGYGCNVVINHSGASSLGSGYISIYGHLSHIAIAPGTPVAQGTLIGHSGGSPSDPCHGFSTGPHLHFELRNNGVPIRGWDHSVGLHSYVTAGDPAPDVPGFPSSPPPPPPPPLPDPKNPKGNLDVASAAGAETLRVAGWSLDPSALTAPVDVHVYVDDVGRILGDTSRDRPDIAAAFPGAGSAHGFDELLTNISVGTHHVCAYAINLGDGSGNTAIGCVDVTVGARDPRSPDGALDDVRSPLGGRVEVRGWSLDVSDASRPVTVHVYMDGLPGAGTGIAILTADKSRPDVAAAFPGAGPAHGYLALIDNLPAGRHQICTYGINLGDGTQNPILGCRTVDVAPQNPIGNLDGADALAAESIWVRGWAVDPSTLLQPVEIHVYVDGTGSILDDSSSPRPDVAAAIPGAGSAHGFVRVLTGQTPGPHRVCAYGINRGAGTENTRLGCQDVTVLARDGKSPLGNFDDGSPSGGGKVQVRGWSLDLSSPTQALQVHVYLDGPPAIGRLLAMLTADQARPDVGAAYPTAGPKHGFDSSIPGLDAGRHQLCAYGINVGDGTQNPILGCRLIDVK